MFHLEYDSILNILTVELRGTLENSEEVYSLLKDVHQSVDSIDKKKNMNRLFDLRDLSIESINADIVQTAAYFLKNFNKDYKPIRIADVVSSDLMFGEHRALAVYSELPHIDRGVFRSQDAARDWLIGYVWESKSDSARRAIANKSD